MMSILHSAKLYKCTYACHVSVQGSGPRIARVLLPCGCVYLCGALLRETQRFSRRMLTRFGQVVVDLSLGMADVPPQTAEGPRADR